MEKHILPADDNTVADFTADIIESLNSFVTTLPVDVSTSSETGEAMVTLYHRGHCRRFRLQLIEITDS